MAKLRQSLQHPDEASYPKDLRTLDQLEVHKRSDKPLQLLEFQNWLESGYNTATIIWDAYKLDCIKDQKTPSAQDL